MPKEERLKLLRELGKTNQGRALEEQLNEELAKIDTVDGILTLDEAVGRQKAKKALLVILSLLERGNPQGGKEKQNYT